MQGGDNAGSKQTPALRWLWTYRLGVCFDYFEKENDAEREEEKEWEGDEVSEFYGNGSKDIEEGTDPTCFAGIVEEASDEGQKMFFILPSLRDDITKGEIEANWILLSIKASDLFIK